MLHSASDTTVEHPLRLERRGSPLPFLALAVAIALPGSRLSAESTPEAGRRPTLVVPRLSSAPEIDGGMRPGEWDRAAVVTGFIGPTGEFSRVMVPKEARIYLAHHDETFYLAVWTQLAPGEKPTMRYRRRDDKVYMDRQQFELWLTPPTHGQVTAYQMIGNAYGAMFDLRHVPSLGVQQPGWDPEWEFENSYRTGEYWIAEFSIAFSELTGDASFDGEEPWGGMVAVAWPQRSWPYTFGWYKNIETHAQMVMAPTDTCVRLLDMSRLFDGVLEPDVTVVNGEEEEGRFVLTAEAGGKKLVSEAKVPAGETRRISLSARLPESGEKVNVVRLTVTGPSAGSSVGERVLLDGEWMCRPIPKSQREPRPLEPQPWEMDTRLAYAPLAMGCQVWVDLLQAPLRKSVAAVRFTVTGEDGAVVAREEDAAFEYDSAEAYLRLPRDLPHGEYTVTTEFLESDGSVLARSTDSFEHQDHRQRFVWLESEKYGERLTVAPPYTPLRVRGESLHVWGRRYEMDGALPRQVTSQGSGMLAGPVTFVAVVDGQPRSAIIAEPFRLSGSADASHARFRGSYELAGRRLELEGHILFDGAITYELNASGGEGVAPVDGLYLSIPVRRPVADYLWSTRGGQGTSHAFLEDLPGRGVAWDSRGVADFVPYLGLADDDRAIQWFADEDHDWILGDDAPCAQVVRRDDVVEMQIHLVRRRGSTEPFSATFGLIATPIKPLPRGWRNAILHYANFAGSRVPFFYGPGHGKVGPFDWHDCRALAEANGIEVPKGASAAAVLDGLSGEGYPRLEAIAKKYGDEVAARVRSGLQTYTDREAVRSCYFHNAQMYFEGYRSEAFRTFFQGDWTIVPPSGWFHLRPVESYQDFFCFHLTQFLKFWHVPGLYFDEVYFAPDRNVFNGQGKVMADGSVRPSVGLTLQRRFLYRARQCCIDQGVPPFLWVHTSNIMAPYAIGAADIAMFGEDNLPTPQQDIMDNIRPQYIRILGRAQKFGFVPVWMTMAGRGGPQWSLAGRQTFGWCWLHDTVPEVHTHYRGRPLVHYRKQWGIDADDVTFHGYWTDQKLIQTQDEKHLVSFWKRPRGESAATLLVMVMNLHYRGEGRSEVEITFDPESLGLPSGWKAYNVESMPDFRRRESILRKLDERTAYGVRRLSPGELTEHIERDLLHWEKRETPGYDLERLEVLSEGEATFTAEVAPRDFLTLILQ